MNRYKKPIIITFFFCILILFIKNQFTPLLLTRSSYGMPALIKQKEIENLYIGSSMFRQGLDIKTLETIMPDKNYILAYNGNQPALEYYQLNYLLKNNVKINHLYIDMYVYSAWEEPELSDEKLLLEMGLKEKWNLWNLVRDKSQIDFERFFRMFVSSNNELLLTWPLNSPLINSQFYKGGALTTPSGTNADNLAHSGASVIESDMNEVQEYYIYQIIQLAQSHNISVSFIETPKYAVIACDDNYLSAMKTYVQLAEKENIPYLISENTARFLGNISPDSDYYTFCHENTNYFMDSIHLSYAGRVAFTEMISSKIF